MMWDVTEPRNDHNIAHTEGTLDSCVLDVPSLRLYSATWGRDGARSERLEWLGKEEMSTKGYWARGPR